MSLQELDHKHILLYASVKSPPKDPDKVKDWFLRLIKAIDMNVVISPQVVNLQTPGNEGITGVVTIETSHSSIHVWETAKVPFIQFDLYSCKSFNVETVLQMFMEFEPYFFEYMLVDRNEEFKIIDKKITQVVKITDLMSLEMKEAYLESKRIKDRKLLSKEHKKAQSTYNSLARLYSGRTSSYTGKRLKSHKSTLVSI